MLKMKTERGNNYLLSMKSSDNDSSVLKLPVRLSIVLPDFENYSGLGNSSKDILGLLSLKLNFVFNLIFKTCSRKQGLRKR